MRARLRPSSTRAAMSGSALLLLAGCGSAPETVGTGNSQVVMLDIPGGQKLPFEVGKRISDTDEVKAMGPDGWHRLVLFGNWDFIDEPVWRWIVDQPDCDRATALAIFWKSQPEYFLKYVTAGKVPAGERAAWDLLEAIRTRWAAGHYTRSKIAFDPDVDLWPVDMAPLHAQYGDRVDMMLPASMRVTLRGRRIEDKGPALPGTSGSAGPPWQQQ